MEQQYKTVRGWSGKTYFFPMTKAEIAARRRLELLGCALLMPVFVFIMALAAGLI